MVPSTGCNVGHETHASRHILVRGGSWLLLSNGGERVLRFVRMMVLARLLTPRDFGLMGLVALAVSITDAVAFAPTNQAIIQHPSGGTKAFLNTSFTIAVMRGIIVAGALCLLAPQVAAFFDEPELTQMVRIVALVPILTGLANPAVQLFMKELAFRQWATYRVASALLAVGVTIGLGWYLRNAWALVYGLVAEQGILLILSYLVVPRRPSFSWDRESARAVLGFCRRALAIPAILMLCMQAPAILLGKLADASSVGTFVLLLTVAEIPTRFVGQPLGQMTYPFFAKLLDDMRGLRSMWERVTLSAVLVGILCCTCFVLFPGQIVHIAYGNQYVQWAGVLRILALYGLARFVLANISSVLWAIGMPHLERNAIVVAALLLYCLGLPAVWHLGVYGMAAVTSGAWMAATVQGLRYANRWVRA